MKERELPYERFMELGARSLTNAELLAIMLRTGTAGRSALEVARQILGEGDTLSVLHDLTLKDLQQIPGIGQVKAVQLLCIAEMSIRLSRERASRKLSFRSPDSVAEYYMEQLRHEATERVLLLLLDSKLMLLREILLSIGSVNASIVSPREIYRLALRENAVHVMLLHNHPSGDPTPSREDIQVTKKVARAGKDMDITLIDHLVIGDTRYVSMKEQGLL